jgi:hypothetical protein
MLITAQTKICITFLGYKQEKRVLQRSHGRRNACKALPTTCTC